MDASQIGIIATSLGVARDMAKAMSGIRDFNLVAEKAAALNDQLLKVQEALLAHNAALFELQNKYFESCEELRKLRESTSERRRYTLFEFPKGHLAYRVNLPPEQSGTSQPGSAEPLHYVCQKCFDEGRKVVLQRNFFMGVPGGLDCPVCKIHIID
jgi:hypothetical protein